MWKTKLCLNVFANDERGEERSGKSRYSKRNGGESDCRQKTMVAENQHQSGAASPFGWCYFPPYYQGSVHRRWYRIFQTQMDFRRCTRARSGQLRHHPVLRRQTEKSQNPIIKNRQTCVCRLFLCRDRPPGRSYF